MAYQLLNITWYYGMFLGPVAGVMIVDYWLIRRRRIMVEELYNNGSKSIYKNGIFLTGVGSFAIGMIGQYIATIIQGKLYYTFGFPLPGLGLEWHYGFMISGLA